MGSEMEDQQHRVRQSGLQQMRFIRFQFYRWLYFRRESAFQTDSTLPCLSIFPSEMRVELMRMLS